MSRAATSQVMGDCPVSVAKRLAKVRADRPAWLAIAGGTTVPRRSGALRGLQPLKIARTRRSHGRDNLCLCVPAVGRRYMDRAIPAAANAPCRRRTSSMSRSLSAETPAEVQTAPAPA